MNPSAPLSEDFKAFFGEKQRMGHSGTLTAERLSQLLAQTGGRMSDIERLLADAFVHAERGDPLEAKRAAYGVIESTSNEFLDWLARDLIFTLGVRVFPVPGGLIREGGSFDYDVAAQNVEHTKRAVVDRILAPVALRQAMTDAYPEGFWQAVAELKGGDTTHLEMLIDFLEADPIFFRSGYTKEKILRLLRKSHVRIPAENVIRLRKLIERDRSRPPRRESSYYQALLSRLDEIKQRS
jgi:hypothetical protein